jgi:hypothetical protein
MAPMLGNLLQKPDAPTLVLLDWVLPCIGREETAARGYEKEDLVGAMEAGADDLEKGRRNEVVILNKMRPPSLAQKLNPNACRFRNRETPLHNKRFRFNAPAVLFLSFHHASNCLLS